ncbi:MAG: TetR/AcrR family transcriptional regulator [Methylobacteriaceae bacterium]|nr:TetR/AcrR family transcriptional regulator [Methylobacteriaceae bacterium]
MARAAKKTADRKTADRKTAAPKAKPSDNRDRIVDALMDLAAEQDFGDITLSMIAERAGLSLADFRDCFPSKGAVLAAFNRRIDRVVLDGATADMADETTKERLFDVLMRRFDALAPYKAAVESIAAWARREPLAAAQLNRIVVNSMRFMLEAAGVDTEGPVGALKLQGLALAWARLVNVWLADEDPGMAATMAELDRTLRRGDMLVARAEDVDRLTSPLRSLARGVFSVGLRFVGDRRARRQEATEASANDA